MLYDQIYANIEFLRPLIKSMTEETPAARPTAVQALEKWRKIRKRISPLHRSWRLRYHGEDWMRVLFGNIESCFHFVPWLSRSMRARFRK